MSTLTEAEIKERVEQGHLSLEGGRIGDAEAQIIAGFLCSDVATNLKTLNLMNNRISAEGAVAIANALKTNTTLKKLYLSGNNISKAGARAFAEALPNNTTLKQLHLANNNICAEGAQHLAEALRNNTTLKKLNLANNNICAEGAQALAEALSKNRYLKALALLNNNISDAGAQALAEVLQHDNTTLKMLNLSNNNIGYDGAVFLAEALPNNTTLEALDLSMNGIGEDGALAFADALENNTTILLLYLPTEGIDLNTRRRIKKYLDRNLNNLLFKAISSNNLNEVKRLNGYLPVVTLRANARARDSDGNSLLHRAVLANNLEIVKFLLDNLSFINIDATNNEDKTALDLAREAWKNGNDANIASLFQIHCYYQTRLTNKNQYAIGFWILRSLFAFIFAHNQTRANKLEASRALGDAIVVLGKKPIEETDDGSSVQPAADGDEVEADDDTAADKNEGDNKDNENEIKVFLKLHKYKRVLKNGRLGVIFTRVKREHPYLELLMDLAAYIDNRKSSGKFTGPRGFFSNDRSPFSQKKKKEVAQQLFENLLKIFRNHRGHVPPLNEGMEKYQQTINDGRLGKIYQRAVSAVQTTIKPFRPSYPDQR